MKNNKKCYTSYKLIFFVNTYVIIFKFVFKNLKISDNFDNKYLNKITVCIFKIFNCKILLKRLTFFISVRVPVIVKSFRKANKADDKCKNKLHL